MLSHLHLPDCIRFAGVCSSWRSEQRSRHIVPPGLVGSSPWLVSPNKSTHSSDTYAFTSCYSASRAIPIPGTSGFALRVSAHGWLLFSSYNSKLNPVSTPRIDFPSWDPQPIANVVLSADPTEPNCFILMLRETSLTFCRLGSPTGLFSTFRKRRAVGIQVSEKRDIRE